MALDLSETALQLDSMADGLKNSVNDSNIRSESASTLLEDFNAKDFEARINLSSKVFNWFSARVSFEACRVNNYIR